MHQGFRGFGLSLKSRRINAVDGVDSIEAIATWTRHDHVAAVYAIDRRLLHRGRIVAFMPSTLSMVFCVVRHRMENFSENCSNSEPQAAAMIIMSTPDWAAILI
jgi:hypothetical protein